MSTRADAPEAGVGSAAAASAARSSHRAAVVDLTELQMRQREPVRRGELECSVSEETSVAVSLLAARESEIGDDLRA